MIEVSRASTTAKGEKPKSNVGEDGKPLTKRGGGKRGLGVRGLAGLQGVRFIAAGCGDDE